MTASSPAAEAAIPVAPPGAEVFAVLVVFVRIGTAIAFVPGFSAVYLPMRLRLLLAILISLLVTPALADVLPAAAPFVVVSLVYNIGMGLLGWSSTTSASPF